MERHPATLARPVQMVATGSLFAIPDGMGPMLGATGVPDSDVPYCTPIGDSAPDRFCSRQGRQ